VKLLAHIDPEALGIDLSVFTAHSRVEPAPKIPPEYAY